MTEAIQSEPAKALCFCGSGLRAQSCCAQPVSGSLPVERSAVEAVELERRAAGLAEVGRLDEAEPFLLEALGRAPERVVALRLLATLRQRQGQAKAAAALFQRAVALDPADFETLNRLTMLELSRGNAAGAEAHARAAVRLAPDHAQAHNLMAMTMTDLHRPVVGEYHCRRALDLLGKPVPLVLANLATNLLNQGRIVEARAAYARADSLAPNDRRTLLAWARLEEADRKFEAALALLDRVTMFAADETGIALARATILGRQGRHDAALRALDRQAAGHKVPLRPAERMERGRLLDRVGQYDEAWADFVAAKARLIEVTGHSYLAAEAADLATRLKRVFTRHNLSLLPLGTPRADSPQPVFILGFPRSGTTMLEQTLTSSPHISAGDELPLVHGLAAIMPRLFETPLPYPEALSELLMGDRRDGLDELRDVYLQRARHLGVMREGAPLFTDKMPLNEVHMGLIGLVFPKAPLIHMVRHPLDIMVSAMSNTFTHGMFCGSALESAATHLMLSADLVDHYRREMDLNYLSVRYEDVVADQETAIRRVFQFAGVSFDPAVLGFENNLRYARTASYGQVTEKLHDHSRFRYRHYRRHLGPAIDILAPLIERLGYSVDEPRPRTSPTSGT